MQPVCGLSLYLQYGLEIIMSVFLTCYALCSWREKKCLDISESRDNLISKIIVAKRMFTYPFVKSSLLSRNVSCGQAPLLKSVLPWQSEKGRDLYR